jgi:hypothetical protein
MVVVVVVVVLVVVVSGEVGRGIEAGPSPGEQAAARATPTTTTGIQRTKP